MTVNIKRFVWADIVRIVAIFLVLLVHSTYLHPHLSFSDLPNLMTLALAKTGVPLFVILSGALLLGRSEPYKVFFSKRLFRILTPWAFWTTVTVAVTHDWQGNDSIQSVILDWHSTLTSFWFPIMILGLYLFTPAMRVFVRSARNVDLLLVLFLWFIGLSVLPYYHETLAFPIFVNGLVPQMLYYSGYFLSGYLIGRYQLTTRAITVGVALCLAGVLWTGYIVYWASLHNGGRVADQFYGPLAPGIVVSSISLYVVLHAAGSLFRRKISRKSRVVLLRVSSAAFGIYLVHQLLMPVLNIAVARQQLHPFVGSIMYAGILFGASALIIIILQQIPYLKRIVS